MVGPIGFQFEVLKRKLWKKQRELCRAVTTQRSVSVKGCHGSGKTFTIAGIVPYELLTNKESVVLTIAPTLRQVKLMWAEIETAIQAIQLPLPERSSVGWTLDKKRYALGFSSSKGVNAQGFHGRRVLILADEAIGIAGDLWDAIEGIRAAGDVRLVKLCNPTVPTGPVYEDFTRLRGSTTCITISAFDTPNLHGLTLETLLQLPEDQLDYAPFPWLTRRRWVREMYYKWGPNNPRFQSRVLGDFPTQADDAVFALQWIEAASLPWDADDLKPHVKPGVYIQVGLDIAGSGNDETCAYARCGPFVLTMEAWSDKDPREKVALWLSKLNGLIPGAQIIVMGDAVGIGYYFLQYLADQGFDVRQFIAGGSALKPERFVNAKAEAYFTLREFMSAGLIHGIVDEDTKAQLSDIRFREKLTGQIEIESKDEARARGSSSPDRAEALVMAFAHRVPRERTVVFGSNSTISPY